LKKPFTSNKNTKAIKLETKDNLMNVITHFKLEEAIFTKEKGKLINPYAILKNKISTNKN